MPTVRTVAIAVFRFAGAVAVGLILLVAAQVVLIVTGLAARWSGLLLFALPAIPIAAGLYAARGRATAADRIAAAAAATASATAFAGIGAAVLLAGSVVLALGVFVVLFAPVPDKLSNFLAVAMSTGALSTLALLRAPA